ncbi:hypothetical protein EVAR_98442_1 [Eumeta japonica]|uniref:Uncharacterized protein n=1 Tax=Eumeta variegata TaxID=151549 RepID=A0A4C1YSX4_EUMVA|nr:hypothetical protein EVAR_98442_1 [Eumeta japonica]
MQRDSQPPQYEISITGGPCPRGRVTREPGAAVERERRFLVRRGTLITRNSSKASRLSHTDTHRPLRGGLEPAITGAEYDECTIRFYENVYRHSDGAGKSFVAKLQNNADRPAALKASPTLL